MSGLVLESARACGWVVQTEADHFPRPSFNCLPLLVEAVEPGWGSTLLPRAAVTAALNRGTVEAWPFAPVQLRRSIHMMYRSQSPGNAAELQVRKTVEEIAARNWAEWTGAG